MSELKKAKCKYCGKAVESGTTFCSLNCIWKGNEIKKLIKHLFHLVYGKIKGFMFTRDLKSKLTSLSWLTVNIIGTGIIITVILELWNTSYRFLSFGLLSAIIMYYLKWFRKLIAVKTSTEIDKL